MKLLFHLFIAVLLTVLTQVGGLIYIASVILFRKARRKFLKQLSFFMLVYLISILFIIPYIAPKFGRYKIEDNDYLYSHSIFYKLTNRNYVSAELNSFLTNLSTSLESSQSDLKIVYLDANFPFLDGFPLLPHLSHNDGNKIDITFIYETADGKITYLKPSLSGYGFFEEPIGQEIDQSKICEEQGNLMYGYNKYLSFGIWNQNLVFSEKGNKTLINLILKHKSLEKLFIEPHLKERLQLHHQKVRFHGCKAVRHDDHIHLQV